MDVIEILKMTCRVKNNSGGEKTFALLGDNMAVLSFLLFLFRVEEREYECKDEGECDMVRCRTVYRWSREGAISWIHFLVLPFSPSFREGRMGFPEMWGGELIW